MDKKKVITIVISIIAVVVLAVVGLFIFKTINDKKATQNNPDDISTIIATDVNGTALVDSLNDKSIKSAQAEAETETNINVTESSDSNASLNTSVADSNANYNSTSNASSIKRNVF